MEKKGSMLQIPKLEEAIILRERGRQDQAAKLFEEILSGNVEDTRALHAISLLAIEQRRYKAATKWLTKLVKLEPTNSAAFIDLATALHHQGHIKQAVLSLKCALKQDPKSTAALNNLGIIYQEQGLYDQALEIFNNAIEIEDGIAEIHNNLGNTYKELEDYSLALVSYQKALALNPSYITPKVNIGVIFHREGKLEQAKLLFEKVLATDPNHAECLDNLGAIYRDLGEVEKSIELRNRSIKLNPHYAESHKNLASALLSIGEYKQGWSEYEWRLRCKQFRFNRTKYPFPYYNGQNLSDKHVLIRAEQGIGDEIMFASMLSDFAQGALSVTVECDARLIPLFERSFPFIEFYEKRPEANSEILAKSIDLQIMLGSLGQYTRNSVQSFDGATPFLITDTNKTDLLRQRYSKLANGKKIIGVSWKSGNKEKGAERSISLQKLNSLLSHKDCFFVSLQYGDIEEEAALYKDSLHLDSSVNPLEDLDNFASQVEAMDLVISIDNSTVHFAGAIGKSCWTLLPFSADWRWEIASKTSVWYPQMKLFWQVERNDWTIPLNKVQESLESIISA